MMMMDDGYSSSQSQPFLEGFLWFFSFFFFFHSISLCLWTITTIRPHTHIFHLDTPTSQWQFLNKLSGGLLQIDHRFENDEWQIFTSRLSVWMMTMDDSDSSSQSYPFWEGFLCVFFFFFHSFHFAYEPLLPSDHVPIFFTLTHQHHNNVLELRQQSREKRFKVSYSTPCLRICLGDIQKRSHTL